MKNKKHHLMAKVTVVALLIISIVLLCPINSVSATTITCDTNTSLTLNHSANGTDSDCHNTHFEFGSHIAGILTAFNYSVALLLVATAGFASLFYWLLLVINGFYLIKLNYFWHRHRVIIKPKLEIIFHRWLNLIGGTVAVSF